MKKAIYIASVIILIVIINGMAHSIYDLWHKRDLVTAAQKELDRQKAENEKLKKRLVEVKSRQFIESEARNKLFLVKPGEREVLIAKAAEKKESKPKVIVPIWQRWVSLFL